MFTSTPRTHAQTGQAGQAIQKIEQISRQLNLTPEQKAQLVPILRAEAPQVKAIKSDTTLTRLQKMERLKALHDQTDPQVKSILNPDQYQKLQEIRRSELETAIRNRKSQ
jgi:hypothetical protein